LFALHASSELRVTCQAMIVVEKDAIAASADSGFHVVTRINDVG
jgi:hypothetical protein